MVVRITFKVLVVLMIGLLISCSSTDEALQKLAVDDLESTADTLQTEGNKTEKDKIEPKLDTTSRKLMLFQFKSNIEEMDCEEKGRIYVSFVVNENGDVVDEKVVQSLSPNCDKAILDAFKFLRFENPGIIDGKPVRVEFTWPFRIQ